MERMPLEQLAQEALSLPSEERAQLASPPQWGLFEDDVRRCLVHVFPYAVLYTIDAVYILIVAMMHCSRKPGYWRLRIEDAR